MGSNSSKTHNASASAAATTTKTTDLSSSELTVQWNGMKNHIENNLLDPRSPDVNRTPIILNNRLIKRTNMQAPVTPGNLRKTLLNGSAKELKLLDPRSPSQFIPRTPLNMSLNGENIDTSNHQFSLEYNGDIEEASCRNFNERLANITFDDLLRENENGLQSHEDKLERIEDISITNVMDDVVEKQTEEEENQNPLMLNTVAQVTDVQTPNTTLHHPNENAIEMDDENISPVIDATSIIKRNMGSAVSSTPISASSSQLKSMLLKKHNKKIANKTEIFIENIEMLTPTKRLAKIHEIDSSNSRTPFGCLLNRRSKSVENLSQKSFGLKENVQVANYLNATPKKQKSTAMLKRINRSGGIRGKNDIFYD